VDGLRELVEAALREDVGSGDVTTAATVAEDATARALITQKAPGSIYGLAAATKAFALRTLMCASSGWWPRACGARTAGR